MKVNLGCGPQVVNGWINVDYSIGARVAKTPLLGSAIKKLGLFNVNWDDRIVIHNLTTKFPWSDASVDLVYSSHTLEHLTREQGRFFISECFRVLRPGGVARIIVPDLSASVQLYLTGEIQADFFIEHLGVLYSEKGRGLKKRLSPFISFPHKCMYDDATLLRAFDREGFSASTMKPFESHISDISDIEICDRTDNAVIVEGIKPESVL